MPRFFFNHRDEDGQQEIDIDGLKLPSLNTALEEASFAAESVIAMAEGAVAGKFEIEDEGRVLVASLPYASSQETDEAVVPPADTTDTPLSEQVAKPVR